MKKILVVVDMQNDFIDGPLGTPEARAIVDRVCEKIRGEKWDKVFVTMDIHDKNYLDTQEGKKLPVEHCIASTDGVEIQYQVFEALNRFDYVDIQKNTFSALDLVAKIYIDVACDCTGYDIECTLIGVCTDICVISNALLLKAHFPEMKIVVDASCCAGSTPEKHRMALEVMESCQIDVVCDEEPSLNGAMNKRVKLLGLPSSPLLDENYGWVKGTDRLPDKSGNYEVRYEGRISRDDYSVFVGRWWNVGNVLHPEEVEWRPNSFREIDL